ncbi:hypothetical protein AB0M20_32695 [Actinoplanes sp. NPDC051633]|uniref:hypothetical protein n=1 Tax=Actinoplanes sp. NPDC051633 TaxID=3155670 RepID=UPI003422F2B5
MTVRAPQPYTTAVTAEVRARAAQAAPPAVARPGPGRSQPSPWWRWWPTALAAVAAIASVALAVRRRRAQATARR